MTTSILHAEYLHFNWEHPTDPHMFLSVLQLHPVSPDTNFPKIIYTDSFVYCQLKTMIPLLSTVVWMWQQIKPTHLQKVEDELKCLQHGRAIFLSSSPLSEHRILYCIIPASEPVLSSKGKMNSVNNYYF